MDAVIQSLGDTLIYEIIYAVGLPKTASTKRTFDLLFHKAAGRLADIGVTFDRPITRGKALLAEHIAWTQTVQKE